MASINQGFCSYTHVYIMRKILFITLFVHSKIIYTNNWIIKNYTDTEDETINFGDDIDDENDFEDQDYFYYEDIPRKRNLNEESRLLDFEELYIKPKVQHNLKLSELFEIAKKRKRNIPNPDSDVKLVVKTENVTESDYNYNQFKAEYDHDLQEILKSQAKLNSSDFLLLPKSRCRFEYFFNKGPITLICLIRELYNGETEEIQKKAKENIKYILVIWLCLIIFYHVIFWAHWGYMSIFPCLNVNPEDAFEQVKQFLVMNAPGTITSKIVPKENDSGKTSIKQDYFEPTEHEFYLYNSLWNDIYRD